LTAFAARVPAAESPQGSGTDASKRTPLIVRAGVDLVQVDAVVVDKKGQYVTDLKLEDFEVLQDGKRRPATYCEYVAIEPLGTPTPAAERRTKGREDDDAPPAIGTVRREDVRRIMTFVVDDLNLSGDGLRRTSDGLRKIVREDVRPGDLIAVVRTSGGTGILQQLTNDPRVLEAAVADVAGRAPEIGMSSEDVDPLGGPGVTGQAAVSETGLSREAFRDRNSHFAEAALMTMEALLESLRQLPGRKSMVVFSERLQIADLLTTGGPNGDSFEEAEARIVAAAAHVTDLANRASTVIYAVDPRGPLALSIGAERNDLGGSRPSPDGPASLGRLGESREERAAQQSGMQLLAARTGGIFFSHENRVENAVAAVREDQKGYYVIGYVPEEGTFDKPRNAPVFHKLKLEVKRPGLTVRSRGAFSPVSDEEEAARPRLSEGEALVQAMISPFASQSIPIRVTPVFGYDAHVGYLMRSYVHVDAVPLSFGPAEGGGQRAKVKLVAGGFGSKGTVLPPIERDLTVAIADDKLEMVKGAGMVLEFSVPMPRPGPYQLRVAVRDAGSGRIGSATQFVDVPDLSKHRLALSGIVLGSLAVRGAKTTGDVAVVAAARLSPAVRRFAAGTDVSYAFALYHPALDKATGRAQFTTRLRLVRQGKDALVQEIAAAVQRPLDEPKKDAKAARGAKDVKPVPGVIVAGTFALPKSLEPGEYSVQLLVTDALAKGAPRAGQWTALEVVAE
jgi:VWFA-related protein